MTYFSKLNEKGTQCLFLPQSQSHQGEMTKGPSLALKFRGLEEKASRQDIPELVPFRLERFWASLPYEKDKDHIQVIKNCLLTEEG